MSSYIQFHIDKGSYTHQHTIELSKITLHVLMDAITNICREMLCNANTKDSSTIEIQKVFDVLRVAIEAGQTVGK